MTRTKLRDRRNSETMKVVYVDNGNEWKILITIGFYRDGRVGEVFCSSFKVGTALNAIVSDACVLLSRLLQAGESPADISASMSEPKSLVGTIAAAIAKRAEEGGGEALAECPEDPVGGGGEALVAAE